MLSTSDHNQAQDKFRSGYNPIIEDKTSKRVVFPARVLIRTESRKQFEQLSRFQVSMRNV